ncbi:response regulator transcription factor [Kineosporia succinea]|uniref:DNA-binding response OmpR family regulator n=1 Tax=Kineosporia succinea TaxID=84632 RepID=A0ABT9PDA3_9ACTN|nr:response regulator transcription factor [Kineosporia succinea]MDP9829955.1 DNA-binding response OmpR family regulator [Kineosporia succinea]
MGVRVLLVEPPGTGSRRLAQALRAHGYDVVHAPTAARGDELVHSGAGVDLLLLDMDLPGGESTRLAGRLSGRLPVIALSSGPSQVEGLDDELLRPYSLTVLLARVDAVTRRALPHLSLARAQVDFGIRLEADTRCIHGPAATVALTAKECDLLGALMRSQGAVVTRQDLMAEVWDITWVGASRTLDVHIATLRGKLAASVGHVSSDREGACTRIDTVRGTGYRLVPAGAH